MKTKKCASCGKEFNYDPLARFKRKYCEKCSKARKKMWDNQWKVKFEDLPDD